VITNNLPLISVIVPNYNHEKYLIKRLDTIFNQSYSNIEVILLDDCSTDNSRQILSEYASEKKVSHCIFNTINSGNTFKQWQKGIDLAQGDFIWIAESDDYCSHDFIEKLITPLLLDEKVVLSYCQSNRVDSYDEVTGNWKDHTDDLDVQQFSEDFELDGNIFIEKYLIYKNVIPNASAVLLRKKNLFVTPDLVLNSDLKTCGDWIVYFQHIIDYKIAFVANSLNNFRYHSNSVIAKTVQLDLRSLIVEINLKMRKVMLSILKNKKPANRNIIRLKNKTITKSLKYEKALLLIRNNEKVKGCLILLSVLDQFLIQYKFKKNLKIKLKKFIS